jgi:uncharacterized membrane protein
MMSESNTDGMMNPEPERNREEEPVEERLAEIYRGLKELKEEVEEERAPDKLGWDDIAQEIVGAVTFALPFIFAGELWEVAKKVSIERSLTILAMTFVLAYLLIAKSHIGNLKKEEVLHIPKRLLTVTTISYVISAALIYLYDINRVAGFSLSGYLNATILISTFAVIGATAVDMVK